MTAPRLWLARHARPLVAAGTCYGRMDVPAEAAATQDAARRLAQALPGRWAGAFHSPLQRCELLAQYLQALRPDWALEPDPRLAEMDFGTWEGRAWQDIGQAAVDAWAADFAHHRPGAGEPLSGMLGRVAGALQEARALAEGGGGDVLWITHAGVVRCVHWLLAQAGRMPLSHEWTAPAPAYGDWVALPLAR